MRFDEYQTKTYVAIQPHVDNKDEILNWSIGLSEECGEVMNHIKHHCWGGEPINKEEIAKEMGDVLWYLSALATAMNINLDTIAQLNEKKLEFRYVGGNFTVDASKQRHSNEIKFKDTEQYKELVDKLCLK